MVIFKWLCFLIAGVAPLAAIASLVGTFFGLGVWGWLLFLWFGFTGKFSWGAAKQFERARSFSAVLAILLIAASVAGVSFALFYLPSITKNTQREMVDTAFGLQEIPKITGNKAWIVDSEKVPLLDTSDRVKGRLSFQAPIAVLEETFKGSRILLFGWLEIFSRDEAKAGEGGKVKTPNWGARILDKPDSSSGTKIGEVNGGTQFYYLHRILDKDSHYYQVVLEGYVPSNSITSDYSRTTIPGTVSGRVTRIGKPAVGLEVALYNWRKNPAITDATGRFLLKQVPPGPHNICWRGRGDSVWTYFMMGGSGNGMLKPDWHLDLGEIDIGE